MEPTKKPLLLTRGRADSGGSEAEPEKELTSAQHALRCCGLAPEITLQHLEKYVYGKELWELKLLEEGFNKGTPIYSMLQRFFAAPSFNQKVDDFFYQFDKDGDGKLEREELLSLLAELTGHLMGVDSMAPEDEERVRALYRDQLQYQQAIDLYTYKAVAKMMITHMAVQAKAQGRDMAVFEPDDVMTSPSTVVIEEVEEATSYGATDSKA